MFERRRVLIYIDHEMKRCIQKRSGQYGFSQSAYCLYALRQALLGESSDIQIPKADGSFVQCYLPVSLADQIEKLMVGNSCKRQMVYRTLLYQGVACEQSRERLSLRKGDPSNE